MATLYTHQASNVRKTWALMAVFLIVVISLGWIFSQVWGNPVILYVAIIFAVVMNFFSYWYSDKIVIRLAGARPASRQLFKRRQYRPRRTNIDSGFDNGVIGCFHITEVYRNRYNQSNP